MTLLLYIHVYKTARLFPSFLLDSQAVYTIYIHDVFYYIWAIPE